jgi:hypothetical protein
MMTEPIEEKSSGYIIQSTNHSGSVCTMNGRAWYGKNEPRAIENKANAELIVQAVNQHTALLACAEALEQVLSTYRTFRDVPKDEREWTPIDDEAYEQADTALSQLAQAQGKENT